ncbi:hypothetical protein, partial [Peptoniphilus sp. BV3AC2]|uniref:hypothetical protein n=1 Tax=Peptoniphilus sp. BV3AC2 TaxID=1111133 RepID=UPI000559D473
FYLLRNLNNIGTSKYFDFYRKMTKYPSTYKVKFVLFGNQNFYFFIVFLSFNDSFEHKKRTYAIKHKSSKIKKYYKVYIMEYSKKYYS